MKTSSIHVRIEEKHIDEGNHANCIQQLAIAFNAYRSFRRELGLGIEDLIAKHGLFFVMREISRTDYFEQLYLGDLIEVRMALWISRPTCIRLNILLTKDGRVAMKTPWEMALTVHATRRPCRIPQWMIDIIGPEAPSESTE